MMATEKRMISLDEALEATHKEVFWTESEQAAVRSFLAKLPRMDAVPVDEIKFLYCAIDKNGIPELKVQLGDTVHCLRRENDPVDVVSVLRCKDCKWMEEFSGKDSGKPCGYGYCKNPIGLMGIAYNESYCSYGEKK